MTFAIQLWQPRLGCYRRHTDELRKMNEHEVERDFEAFVQQEYPKYRHVMPGVRGFNLNLMRDRKIRELILQDFVKKRQH